MDVRDLIERLQKFPQEDEVMILDGFNGGGLLRDINLGPVVKEISDKDEDSDGEGRKGERVVAMGYGCY